MPFQPVTRQAKYDQLVDDQPRPGASSLNPPIPLRLRCHTPSSSSTHSSTSAPAPHSPTNIDLTDPCPLPESIRPPQVGVADPLPVDDVIAVGSPGMQAKHPGDLGLDPTHMWAEGGGGLDHVVRDGGRFMGLGGGGNIPTDPAFGGNIMASDAHDHSAYWNMDNGKPSVSLKNQAEVVVGRYDNIKLTHQSPYGAPR
ncbi:alpha/beta hydrolase [Streptomyces sp. NBC_01198]|uniref:alpha/beta hydrolase n=1 Tax=Streptomyces sp. NBC_01198 TaxID=2903769 RepID=UPI002E1316C4|nr:alpha/beta hydrolase family protein [Streptomyces sp. NBC_01198]